ncbi:LAFA_0B05314g1_1 [Lachancea sp. 'fantastica']|nr:LAFA_0B05314g1_1 [Lachancea sp. 'fantastica']
MDADNTIIYVKVSGRDREGFVEPPKFHWDLEKDQKLWLKISRFGNKKSIDWVKLSREFETPEFFLRKRSYRLFAKHLRMLEHEIETKTRGLDVGQELEVEEDDDDGDDLRENTSSQDGESKAKEEEENGTPEGVKNLRWSRILNQKIPGDGKAQPDSSLSELSNLSVSKSALEEALLDRLQL